MTELTPTDITVFLLGVVAFIVFVDYLRKKKKGSRK